MKRHECYTPKDKLHSRFKLARYLFPLRYWGSLEHFASLAIVSMHFIETLRLMQLEKLAVLKPSITFKICNVLFGHNFKPFNNRNIHFSLLTTLKITLTLVHTQLFRKLTHVNEFPDICGQRL